MRDKWIQVIEICNSDQGKRQQRTLILLSKVHKISELEGNRAAILLDSELSKPIISATSYHDIKHAVFDSPDWE